MYYFIPSRFEIRGEAIVIIGPDSVPLILREFGHDAKLLRRDVVRFENDVELSHIEFIQALFCRDTVC